MRFKTESGTVYLLDKGTMGWCRESKTALSGEIRQDFGTLLSWPEIFIGKAALLHDSRVKEGCSIHYIHTSPVKEILDA